MSPGLKLSSSSLQQTGEPESRELLLTAVIIGLCDLRGTGRDPLRREKGRGCPFSSLTASFIWEKNKNASFYKQGSDIRTSGPPAGAQAEGESVKCWISLIEVVQRLQITLDTLFFLDVICILYIFTVFSEQRGANTGTGDWECYSTFKACRGKKMSVIHYWQA